MNDPVNKPPHYDFEIEPRDAISAWGLNFDLGSAVKYIVRAGRKDPTKYVEDLQKAISCIAHEIMQESPETVINRLDEEGLIPCDDYKGEDDAS